MSDVTRTALKGGGTIRISVNMTAGGSFELQVTESWGRLTSVERSSIPAEELDAAEDQDAMIREELTRLVRRAHINWEAGRIVKEDNHG